MYLKSMIKSKASSKIFGLLFILIVFSLLLLNFLPMANYAYSPPKPINNVDELIKAYENNERYVEFKDIEVFDSGLDFYQNEDLKTYFFAPFDDGILVMVLPNEYINKSEEELMHVSFTGIIREFKDEELVRREEIAEIISGEILDISKDEVLEYIPYLLFDNQGVGFGKYALPVLAIIVALILFYLIKEIITLFNYKSGKEFKQLENYGDPDEIEEFIDNELDNGDYYYRSKFLIITKNYIIANTNNIIVRPTKDLQMIYTYVLKQKYAGFITISKSYFLHMYFDGEKKEKQVFMKKEKNCEEALLVIEGKLPVITYYDEKLVKLFKKDKAEFERILQNQNNQ